MSNSMDEDTPTVAAAAAAAAAAEIGSYRDALPTHFTFKIQSFSLLATSLMEKFESNEFEAGGYKWRLVFYPKGNKTSTTTSSIQNGGSSSSSSSGNPRHVSMYLKIDSLPRGWVVDASFRFFVLDQIRDKYLILGDMGGKTRRFHEMNTMWGYDQLLPLTTLKNDSSNGYVVNNACVFGVEVFPCKNTGCGDCLTMVESPSCVKYTWNFKNFSKIKEQHVYSDVFNAGQHKWKIQLYPKGDSRANSENLSLYVCSSGSTNTVEVAGEQVYAQFMLRVRDQLNNFHKEVTGMRWFISPYSKSWGSVDFMRLGELNDLNKGYLVNDTCIVEAEVTVLGAVKKLS